MNRIVTTTDIIYNENAKKDITIVHISDMHFNENIKEEKLNKLSNYIIKQKPDYVAITGDTVDNPAITKDKTKIKRLITFLTTISETSKVIISLGNHDIQTDEDYRFFDKLDDLYNIYCLNNTSYHDEFVYFFGITLPNSYYYSFDGGESIDVLTYQLNQIHKKIERLPKNLPKVAMIHSPTKLSNSNILNKLKEFDIILCGHTHNGMVPERVGKIIKNNIGIISPRKRLFPNNARGKIEKSIGSKKINIIINGGITKISLSAGKIISKFNAMYKMSVNKIIIRKKRGMKYE